MPTTHVILDVFHMIMRYLVTIINGTNNPNRPQVAQEITDAILVTTAQHNDKTGLALYRAKDDQEVRLQMVFEKWSQKGGVWSAASSKVHADQLNHIRKGCLERTCQDIHSDGSSIEGSQKGWNSLMRSFTSGIEVFAVLAHDHVLRRNLHITHSSATLPPLVMSSYGCHHIRLVDHIAQLWNTMIMKEKSAPLYGGNLQPRPILHIPNSSETFGLVHSAHTKTFGGLLKTEDQNYNYAECGLEAEVTAEDLCKLALNEPLALVQDMGIDPSLLFVPHTPSDMLTSSKCQLSLDLSVKATAHPKQLALHQENMILL
ncbi:hypothetical protein SERLA73DRAFT_73632 [Serpula lacrymans var. lacrymans S7.3]|uniref:Uncharacterized protein n=1 Tax=Serpula lacrymans var. lacrymans (strain S7.3) TaxID=936435 RepID=F8PYU8_SERL3|nr:hypothetical protein SERLA73DRAFT_73632 [Serpula lacrymans var. lacrymans S7.3]